MQVGAIQCIQVHGTAAAAAPGTVGGHHVPQGEVGGGEADDLCMACDMWRHVHSSTGGQRQVGDMGDDVDGGVDDTKDVHDL